MHGCTYVSLYCLTVRPAQSKLIEIVYNPEPCFKVKLLATNESCLFFHHVDKPTQFREVWHSLLNLASTKDPSDISSLYYRNPLRKSDHLVTEFALAVSLSTRLVKHYWKLDTEKVMEVLFCTCPIEVHSDWSIDWQLMKINIVTIDENCVPANQFTPTPFKGPSGLRREWIATESSGLRIVQSTKIVRLLLTAIPKGKQGHLQSALLETAYLIA